MLTLCTVYLLALRGLLLSLERLGNALVAAAWWLFEVHGSPWWLLRCGRRESDR